MNKPKIRKVYKQVLALIAIPFILTGCQRADCKISERHVHKYVGTNKRGTITTYLESENLEVPEEYQDGDYTYINFERKDDYLEITEDDKKFYDAKGTMFYGRDNWEFLYSVMSGKKDYIEYEYGWSDEDGMGTSWTKRKPSGFTGKIRINHYRFCGHKLTYKDGKYINERSPFVDDIREIIDEYPYFEIDCYTVVHKDYKVNKKDLNNIRMEDYNEFNHPDLENKELYTIKK